MPDPSTRSVGRPESGRLALTRSPSSVVAARRFIQGRAVAWSLPGAAVDQLVLIGSELVTNTVLHARTELTLVMELRDGRVRISVTDRSQAPATMRHYRPTPSPAGAGRGRRPQRPVGGERRRRGPELPGPARAGRRAVPLRPPPHPEPPAHVRSLRRWFVEEMAAQLLDDASPTPPPST